MVIVAISNPFPPNMQEKRQNELSRNELQSRLNVEPKVHHVVTVPHGPWSKMADNQI